MQEQSLAEELHPTEGMQTEAVHKELQSMGKIHIKEVHGGLFPTGGSPHWKRGKV